MSVGGDVLGVLKIGWRRPHLGSEFDPDLLSTIGRQVGMALHNAQLYQAARQVDRLQILSDLTRRCPGPDLPTLAGQPAPPGDQRDAPRWAC
jgi:hypothetical protein